MTSPEQQPYSSRHRSSEGRPLSPDLPFSATSSRIPPYHELTEGQKVILFIETFLRIPEGKYVGQRVVLREWQKRIILDIYDDPETSQVIISFPRKNGKTALIAMLIAAHIIGPVAETNSQIYSSAQSREQAAIVFNLLAKMIRMDETLLKECRILDSTKTIRCRKTGVMYKALAADAKTTFGLSPIFVVHDELGQVRGPSSDLYDALETGMGAHERPLSVIISTQAQTDQDLLSILIDDAKKTSDPSVKLHLWEAPKDADPFDEEVWHACNPALGDFLNLENLRRLARKAERLPVQESSFRNLRLNQRVTVSNVLLTDSVWSANGADPDPGLLDDEKITLAVDLSGQRDLTCVVATVQKGDETHVFPYFWTPEDTLIERSERDRTSYDMWVKQGAMFATPGKSVDYSFVARFVVDEFAHRNVDRVIFDRWRINELKREFDKLSWDPPLVEHGQGFRDMSPAVDSLEHKALEGRLRHGGHPVLTYCMSNAVVTMDAAGNRKLDKMKATGRIDGAVALVMALRPEEEGQTVDIEAMIG